MMNVAKNKRRVKFQTTGRHPQVYKQLVKKYEKLKIQLENGTEEIFDKGWEDDSIYHLTRVYRFFAEKEHFLLIYLQKNPNISYPYIHSYTYNKGDFGFQINFI